MPVRTYLVKDVFGNEHIVQACNTLQALEIMDEKQPLTVMILEDGE